MLGFAAVVSVVVLLSTFGTNDRREPTLSALTVDVGDMAPGTSRLINREGRAVIIVRRDTASISANRLTDNDTASDIEWFVALAVGTDFSCVVNWYNASDNERPLPTLLAQNDLGDQDWRGGFRDTCRGSWYDANGRVLGGQYAQNDLTTYRFNVVTQVATANADASARTPESVQLHLE